MRLVYFHTACSRNGNQLKDLIVDYCLDNEIDFSIYDCDEDANVMNDYDVHGMPPAFVVFNDAGRKIVTRKGKFTEEDLNKIFQAH